MLLGSRVVRTKLILCCLLSVPVAADDIPGDVFELERVPGGPHAVIMRYNLNAG